MTLVCMQVGKSNLRASVVIVINHHFPNFSWLYDSNCMQVGSSNLRASTSLDTPGSSGLQFELNNLRNELRAKQREHSETEEEVGPCCHVFKSQQTDYNADHAVLTVQC